MPNFWERDEPVGGLGVANFWEGDEPVREEPWERDALVTDPGADLRIADTEHKLRFARKRVRQSPLPEVFSALTQVTFRGLSKVQRATGFGDADESNRIADAFATASAEMDRERPGPLKWIAPAVRGAAVSMPEQVAAGMAGGPAAAIGVAMAGEANQAITEGRDAGLEGTDLAAYASSQGVIEGAPAYVMQKIGLGGFEGMFGKQASKVVSRGVMDGLKSFGIQTLAEIGEENLTELGHNAARVVADIAEDALDPKNIWATVKTTTAQTLAQMGMAGGGQAILSKAESAEVNKAKAAREKILEMDESGDTPSRKEWTRKLGMSPLDGKTAERRKEILNSVANEIRRQDAAREEPGAASGVIQPEPSDEALGPPEAVSEAPADDLGQTQALSPGLEPSRPASEAPADAALREEASGDVDISRQPGTLPQQEEIAAPTEGETVGLSKEAGIEIRETIGAAALNEEAVQTHASVLEQAKVEQVDVRAVDIADRILKTRRQVTTLEHAGMVIRAGQLLNDLDKSRADQAKAAKDGDQAAYDDATAADTEIVKQLDVLTEAARNSRREVARALSIGRLRLSREKFDVASVMDQVRAAKGPGGKLTDEDLSRINARTKKVKALQSEVEAIEKRGEAADERKDRAVAEGAVKAERAKKKAVRRKAREKIRVERDEIKKKIRGLGLRVNDITGIPVEGAYLLGQLGLSYVREGVAVTLPDVIEKLRNDVPELNLTPGDVYRLLTMQNPRAKRKAKTEAQKRVANVKATAKILDELEAMATHEGPAPKPPSRRRAPTSPELKRMRSKLTAARQLFYASSIEAGKLEAAIERLNRLQDRVANGIGLTAKRQAAKVPVERQAVLDEIKEVREIARLDEELSRANRQLETGIPDEKVARQVKPVSERLIRKRIELKKAKDEVRQLVHAARPWTTARVLEEAAATLKTLKATADMSFTFRQNIWQVLSHPSLIAKTFVPGWKAFLSEYSGEEITDALTNEDRNPNAFLYEKSGLAMMDATSLQDNKKAEVYRSSVIERSNIPILKQMGWVMKASSRHAVAVGNIIRASAFDAFVAANPNLTDAEMRAFADYLNVSTGLGNLGRVGAVAKELNLLFFSPRYAVSRIQTPLAVAKHYKHPRVRKKIAKDMAGFVATGGMVLTLAAMAGAELEWDPESADWGKIRFGDTRVDIWGGFQQPARVIARLATNPLRKDADWRPLELLGRFAAFKLAPAATMPIELVEGKTAVGEETSRTATLARAFVPLVLEDVREAWKAGGAKAGAAVGALAFHGVGASTYRDSETVTRNKIRRMMRSGEYVEAETARELWNANNPMDRIVTVKLK
jgi:hypothetical protein